MIPVGELLWPPANSPAPTYRQVRAAASRLGFELAAAVYEYSKQWGSMGDLDAALAAVRSLPATVDDLIALVELAAELVRSREVG